MTFEQETLNRYTPDMEKLIPYGFTFKDDVYSITKNILNNQFRCEFIVKKDSSYYGRVIDLGMKEEYINFRIETIHGDFVNQIREEYQKFLLDIRSHCFKEQFFVYPQSNRITDALIAVYNDKPLFKWKDSAKDRDTAVFQNQSNEKWYGIIMHIDKAKLERDVHKDIEVLDIKLEPEEIHQLLGKEGFYLAYHMNKENWITIPLDDTLKDEEILKYLAKSKKLTSQPKNWLIPANPKYYDCIHCFNDTDTITWKQSSNIQVGDIVYMYVAAPYSCILYKLEVLKTDIPFHLVIDDLRVDKEMEVRLLKRYDKDLCPISLMSEYGVKYVRGPRYMPERLIQFLEQHRS